MNRTTQRLLAIGLSLLVIATIALMGTNVFAHNPTVVGETSCRADNWTVTWTVGVSATSDLTWTIERPADAYPTGPHASDIRISRTTTHPAAAESATETVLITFWREGEIVKRATRGATVARPPLCEEVTTTTWVASTTSAPPVDSTVPGTTTTTTVPTGSTSTTTTVSTPTTTSPTTSSTTPPPASSPPPEVPELPATGFSLRLLGWGVLGIVLGFFLTEWASRRPR